MNNGQAYSDRIWSREQALEFIRSQNSAWCCFQDFAANNPIDLQVTAKLAEALGYAITADKKSWYKKPKTIQGNDLVSKVYKQPDYIVQGLLPVGLCIFAAPPKTGKSLFCLDLCRSVDQGNSSAGVFLGRKTNVGECLYLALEDGETRLSKRLKLIGVQPDEQRRVQYWLQAPRLGRGLIDALTEWVQNHLCPKLIVIDTFARVKPQAGAGTNTYNADYDLLAPLQRFALEKQLAVILVTHNSKAKGILPDDPFERITGSMGQMGVADTMWMIAGKREDPEKKFFATGRDSVDVEQMISLVDCKWVPLGSIEERQKTIAYQRFMDSPVRQVINEMIEESPSKTVRLKYDELWEQIARRKNVYPFATPKELSYSMPGMYQPLLQVDNIIHDKDSHNNTHKFQRKPVLR